MCRVRGPQAITDASTNRGLEREKEFGSVEVIMRSFIPISDNGSRFDHSSNTLVQHDMASVPDRLTGIPSEPMRPPGERERPNTHIHHQSDHGMTSAAVHLTRHSAPPDYPSFLPVHPITHTQVISPSDLQIGQRVEPVP